MKYWNNGFYDNPKEGRVEITDKRYETLLYGQAYKELTINSDDDGYPQLYDSDGEIFDGDVYTYDHTLMPSYVDRLHRQNTEAQLQVLKARLTATDYKVVKNHEYIDAGLEPPYDPMELFNEREPIREQIRELEEVLI